MNGYWITGIAATIAGAAIGVAATHAFDSNRFRAQLDTEKVAEARDLAAISKTALDAYQGAVDAHTVAEGKIATLDDQLMKEKQAHEADNARNRVAIADGSRRLRIAVSDFHPAGRDESGPVATAGSVGDDAGGTAELSPALGLALFAIADDADGDRRKVVALQGYVCAVRPETAGCSTTSMEKGAAHEQ